MDPATTTSTSAEPAEREYVTPLQRALREDGRKQRWLAQKVGISDQHMSTVVRGMVPDADTKAAIARVLNRDIEELWPKAAA